MELSFLSNVQISYKTSAYLHDQNEIQRYEQYYTQTDKALGVTYRDFNIGNDSVSFCNAILRTMLHIIYTDKINPDDIIELCTNH